jgi:transformation/transcription domain-associated protein
VLEVKKVVRGVSPLTKTEIHQSLERLLAIIFKAINEQASTEEEDVSDEVQTFTALISNAIQEHLSSTNQTSAAIMMACSLVNYKASAVDSLLASIMKMFGKLCKDHTQMAAEGEHTGAGSAGNTSGSTNSNTAAATTNGSSATVASAEIDPKHVVVLIEKILDLASLRVSYLGDQRRVFLSLVAQLIERSKNHSLCMRIVDMTRNWVFSKTDLFPTIKEKAAILSKMMAFEARGDTELTKTFYSILVNIYDDPALSRSELSVRMEHAFLVGTRLPDIETRQKLMHILNESIDDNVTKRLQYIIADQNWEFIGDSQWLNQALQILYGGVQQDKPLKLRNKDFMLAPLHSITDALPRITNKVVSDELVAFAEKRREFVREVSSSCRVTKFISPLIELQYQSPELVHNLWIAIFPIVYSGIARKDRIEMIRNLTTLFSKDYHNRQADARPNVIQTLLEAIGTYEQLPPQLVKYLGMSFNAWHPAIQVLENGEAHPQSDSVKISESNLDALAEMYAGLQDDDMFYGLWRRRSKYTETNSGLSFEQCGMWSRAMQMYEAAQIKARSGVLPYGESEYGLWEDHWILCAQKLQQWDILTELAKHEGFTDLLLECGWRVADWTADKEPLEQSIKTVMDVPTPRRQIFETFLCLQGYAQKTETIQELSKYCDEGIQLALRKWYSLPANNITGAHIPLLHTFQQYVEFMEASQVYSSLASTTAQNLDAKSQELKGVLQAWRERLPNIWDDINIWGDLVTWRQHAFGVINKVYLPLIPSINQANGSNNSTNSYAYRGYHEIAWIINRFAHVARKHNMPEVCISQLTKIYQLPNIEIQEAFLKLREQAKCHYQNPNEMNTGLDVISNTNLVYFGAQQKAEFFTLKGMFLAKLNAQEDANQAFATAVQIDLYLPKAWAEWGYFNDRRFKEHPDELIYASNAISCYLQAAGLYKNSKTRKLLGRILWLISLDDANGSIAQAFDSYRGEVPVWYWITYIPQLLTSLSRKEARLARHVLIKIAKSYPQALHFHLRTSREDYAVSHKQQAASQRPSSANPGGNANLNSSPAGGGTPGGPGAEGTAVKQPWDYVEEIMGILKTAYPLLALSLETFVDQIYNRFKCPADEDAYRLIVALLNDGIQFMGRLQCPKEDAKLPPATETNITRFAESVLPKHIKPAFEKDFVTDKPNLEAYVMKLRKWRDRFEGKLDARPDKVNLENLSPPLSEFHYQKFEDVEVPGQYFEHKDNNMHFVKIDRFLPTVDVVRGFGICYRRLTIRGHDGSVHPFAVQYPAARHCRREERVAQLFKILNGVIARRKESRRRNLQFTLPVAIPLSPHIRIVQDDARYVSMHAIYEQYCRDAGQSRDAPLDFATKKLRAAFDPHLPKPDIPAIKMEILTAVQATLVPSSILRDVS